MHDTMSISISDGTLRIDDFETRERDIVDYFNKLHDSDAEEKLVVLLKLGILAQTSVGTTMDAKYVESEFNRIKDEFDQRMADIFEPNGTMDNRLAEHFGQDGKIIKEIFNPENEGTPLNRLKTALHEDLVAIRDKMVEQKGRKMESQKGTQKGTEFEDFCQPFLEDTARMFSDIVEPTGTSKTKGTEKKKGDFVVTLADNKKRIVFEMKDRGQMSPAKIMEDLSGAIDNRDADYGVMVSKGILSRTIGSFNECDHNKLVCALAEDADDDVNTWMLEIAYKWARRRVVSTSDSQIDVDPDLIKQNVKEIDESLSAIHNIKTKCKNIRESADAIEGTVDDEERTIKNKIRNILSSMDSTNQS